MSDIKWSVVIEKVDNGYIVTPSEDTDFPKFVVPINDGNKVSEYYEQEAFKNLAYELMNIFAVNNNKHAYDGKGQFIEISVSDYEE